MKKRATPTYLDFVDQRFFVRLFEILPGLITWLFLLSPIILSLVQPIIVAYFVIAFDLFWLIKSLRLSYFLIRGYDNLHRDQQINWYHRLKELSNIDRATQRQDEELVTWLAANPTAKSYWPLTRAQWLLRREYSAKLKYLRQLRDLQQHQQVLIDPVDLQHVVIIATYNESIEVLEPAVKAIIESNYSLDKINLVIAYEERGGQAVRLTVEELIRRYGAKLGSAQAIMHPDGLPDEGRTKGANMSYAAKQVQAELEQKGIQPDHVIVTSLDADHQVSKDYFAYLTYNYAIDPNRTHKSFQPIPMFYNNIWDVPAPMRIIATGNSFWILMETMRPHRLRNFAAHAQSLQTLIDTDFWSKTSIVEDGHQYWRTYFTYNGDHSVVPLYVPVFQDAVLATTLLQTFKFQYIQLRRWAWGVSDLSYVVRESIKNRQIAWSEKLIKIWRLFEGHFSWATASLILIFAAWTPLYLNRRFADQLLAHELPIIASRILNFAMLGLAVSVIISLISLPKRPERYGRIRILTMLLSWLALPLIAIVFSTFAAIDAQTRLMFGRYLDWRVTVKAVKK